MPSKMNSSERDPKSVNITYYTRFKPRDLADGGNRRAAQMAHVFEKYNLTTHTLTEPHLSPAEYLFARAARKLKFLREVTSLNVLEELKCAREVKTHPEKFKHWQPNYRRAVAQHWHACEKWIELHSEKIAAEDVAVVDDPILLKPLVTCLGALKIPVVSICHNLESLLFANSPALFREEMDLLRKSARVITISERDTATLAKEGIPSIFFPYFPVPEILGRMFGVRDARRTQKKRDFLLLGSAHNPHTAEAMKKIIRAWASQETLIVVGFSTERIKHTIKNPKIQFFGRISDQKLDALLSRVKACICETERVTGALTKIPEMAIAGVPVVKGSGLPLKLNHNPSLLSGKGRPDPLHIYAAVEGLAPQISAAKASAII